MPFIDNLESAISSRLGGGDPRFQIDEAQFAEDAIGGNGFEMETVNENVDLSFLDNIHLPCFVSLFENAATCPKGPGIRSICENLAVHLS